MHSGAQHRRWRIAGYQNSLLCGQGQPKGCVEVVCWHSLFPPHLSCPGPWALKKALVSLLDRLPGFHVSWFALSNTIEKPMRRSQSTQWAPADDELWAGIQDINENAPECDSESQQYVKENAETPISGQRPKCVSWRKTRRREWQERNWKQTSHCRPIPSSLSSRRSCCHFCTRSG